MNYRNENATPRDRNEGCAFSQNTRSGESTRNSSRCGCSGDARTVEYNCGCDYVNENAARSAECTGGCGCNNNYNTVRNSERTSRSGCGCNRNSAYSTRRAYSREGGSGSQRGTCGSDNGHLRENTPIAMVYSPMQQWQELYDPHTALGVGTIFRELDLPFYPTPCRRKENGQCQYR